MDYEALLERLWQSLPSQLRELKRFEVPKAECGVEGDKTVLRNFQAFVKAFNRDPKHLLKFLSHELGVPVVFDGKRAIVQRIVKQEFVQRRLEEYASTFVLCDECKRPDTRIVEFEGQKVIRCEACGGWKPLRKI